MLGIEKRSLPAHALLGRYAEQGKYTDCYSTWVPGEIAFADYVLAFYTTWLFKTERVILKWAVSRPSTDEQAEQLAQGELDAFAAWTVEDRADDQLLLKDFQGRTCSWLMVAPETDGTGRQGTRLYFGSAVLVLQADESANTQVGGRYRAAMGLHKLYSVLLLRAVRARLR